MSQRAVLYARVSYDDRKNEARNLEGQIEDGRAYCREKGYTVIAELTEDVKGVSGADWDLPAISQALDMAQAGKFDILIVRELDRFARDTVKTLTLEKLFKSYGARVEYILDKFEDTPEGQFTKTVRAGVAQLEKDLIAARLKRARRLVVKSGKVMLHGDNKAPYGYRHDDGRLVVCDEEAKVVNLIYTWYVHGDGTDGPLSIRQIARCLTKMEILTHADKHPGRFKKNGKGVWSPSVVVAILSNETHCGLWHYKCAAGWLSVEVPAIVSRELWEKAQERRAYNAETSKRNTKRDYLLAQKGTCQCGSRMSVRTTISGSCEYPYYYCPAARGRLVGKTCDMPLIRADHVDAAVWEWVKGLLMNPEKLRKNLEEQQAEQEEINKPLWDQLAVVDDLLTQKRAECERCFQAYVSGKWDEGIALREKAQLDKVIDDLGRRRADLLATIEGQIIGDAQIATLTEFAQAVSGGLAEADEDFEARRQIIDLLDVRVTLAVEGGQKVIYIRCLVDETELSIVSIIPKSPVWDKPVSNDLLPGTVGC